MLKKKDNVVALASAFNEVWKELFIQFISKLDFVKYLRPQFTIVRAKNIILDFSNGSKIKSTHQFHFR